MLAPRKRRQEKFLAPSPPKKPFKKPAGRTALVSDILGGMQVEAGITFERLLVKPTEVFKYLRGLEKKYWRRYKRGNRKLENESTAFFRGRVLSELGVKDNNTIKRVQEIQKKADLSLAKRKTPEGRMQVDRLAFIETQKVIGEELALKFYMEMYDIMQWANDLRNKRS